MKKNLISVAIVVIVVLAIVIVLIQIKREPAVIKIGVILPLSGSNAKYGEWTKEGMELALEDVRHKYPKYEFKLIYEDDEARPEKTVGAFNKLIKYDRVPVVTGVIASQLALAVSPIAEREKIVLLSTGASSDKLKEAGDFIFRIRESSKIHGEKAAEEALSISNRSAVIFLNAENGISYAEEFRRYYEKRGGQIALWEAYNEGENDFRLYLTKVKEYKIDVVYIPGLVSEIALLLRQAREMGIGSVFISSVGAQHPNLLEIAKDAAEGLLYTYPSFDVSLMETNESIRQFVNRFKQKYGHDPDFLAANGYDSINLLAQIIVENGYSSIKIKNGLYIVKDFKGLGGKLSFDRDGEVIKPVIVKIVKNQQFQVKY